MLRRDKLMKLRIPLSLLFVLAALSTSSCQPALPSDLPGLMQVMGSNDMAVNFDAARRVDKLYGKAGLLEALKHQNTNTRAVAAHFLMKHQAPDVQVALLEATRDPDEYVRMWAAFSLGKIGDHQVVGRMKELTKDPSEVVSRRATSALEDLTNRSVAEPVVVR